MLDILLVMIEIAGGIILAVLFFSFFEAILKISAFIFLCGLLLALVSGIVIGIEYLELTAKDLGLIILSILGFWIYIELGSSFCYWIEGLFEKKNKTD